VHVHALSIDDARARLGTGAWLDVRDEPAFAAGHLPGAGHVPESDWERRTAELPPRDEPVVVVADDPGVAQRVADRMEASGFAHADWLERPWRELGVAADRGPAARLWRPAPFLERVLPAIPRGRALDLACGSGRDAVFLAMHDFDVEACDRDAAALETVERIARRHGVAVTTRRIDLEAPEAALGESAWDLIVCVRFLERPLFPAIARALAPGGHLVYDTYREGQERFGKPRRARFLLRPGELRAAFVGLDVLAYEEPSPPGGPWTARLHARRGTGA